MDTNYNRKNRRKYSLKAPIVLVTKYRKQLPRGIIMETDKDPIHFLISHDTTVSICEIVKRIK